MPNTRETLRALVSAFNVNNYDFNAVKTNFTLQSRYGKDCIVVLFDKGMKDYQCSEYLYNIKRKIVGEFYGIEEGDTDEVVLNTANLIFDVESFPFNNYKGSWSVGKHGGFEFVAPIDKGVIFNLKSHLASLLKKDVIVGMPTCSIVTNSFNKGKYLCHSKFPDKELRKQFESMFLFRMEERYENAPKNPLKVEGNSVYIKDVFDDARFVDSITRRAAWRIGIDLGVSNDVDHSVMLLKDSIINSFYQSTKTIVAGFMCASPLNREEASILIPIMQDCRGARFLTKEEARDINHAFNNVVLDDVSDKTQATFKVNGSSAIYGIDFSNKEISHCVVTKIIESSVINKDHELAIDPELHLQALSPAQSPVRVPNGPSSGLTELSSLIQEFPTRDQNVVLKDSPRRESEKFPVLLPVNQLDVPGTSRKFLPRSHLSSSVTNPHSSKCVSAAKNVRAGTNPWAQPIGFLSSPAPSAGPSLWQPSRPLSRKGANESGSAWASQPIGFWSLQSSNLKEDCKKIYEDFEEAYEKIVSDSSLSKEEQELSKALLYWFNLNNYALDPPHTNFIVKNGKIASLIDDSVDVKEYLQEVIDKTKEEYCVNKKEAYDLNEFPFKFLSNCEKNQETTVVANISHGALLNLKELFSQGHEGKVEIKDIDINIVKKAVKSKKDKWVNFQVREHGLSPKAAIETCCPDESALEYISITKGEGGHWIDRNYDASEVKSFREERWPAKGTSKAEKMKSEDNKDSGYSSGFVTDAENVSSKADAITSSGYESMDCENTGGGSPKRKSEKPLEGSPEKSLRRDSSPLSRLESLSLSSSSHQIGKC
ncbi:MAG: hypothetical protein ACR5K5_04065 [Wolbachia sp.]